MTEIIIFITVFLLTFAGVEVFRRWSLRREILDIPNERSSHQNPTPRGGGVIIVFVTLAAYMVLGIVKVVEINWYFLFSIFLIAFISWLDDLFSVSFLWRLLVHTLAAGIVIYFVGFFRSVDLPLYGTLEFGVSGMILTYLWIVWITNAYNFMDGIDGIAGLQAIAAGVGWLLAGSYLGLGNAAIFGALLSAAAAGFLIHNWQPAKIFMGDVGSAFFGFGFAVLPLLDNDKDLIIQQALIPLLATLFVWLFLFDTVFTFLKRLLGRKRVWEAHREHLYQKLVIEGFSHQTVSTVYGGFSLLNSFYVYYLLVSGRTSFTYLMTPLLIQSALIMVWVWAAKRKNGRPR